LRNGEKKHNSEKINKREKKVDKFIYSGSVAEKNGMIKN
jgi:hypothetical protein